MRNWFLARAGRGLFVLAFALCGSQANAQAEHPNTQTERPRGERMGRGGPMSPDQELQRLTQALSLTEDQQKQIRTILEDRQHEMQSLFSDSSTSREDKMSKARSIREDSNKKIREALNDDQKPKFEELQKQMRERMEKHRSGTGNKGPDKTDKN